MKANKKYSYPLTQQGSFKSPVYRFTQVLITLSICIISLRKRKLETSSVSFQPGGKKACPIIPAYAITFLYAICLTACNKEPVEIPTGTFLNTEGVFIVNEGNFMHDNSSLSFYEYATGKVYNRIFYSTNNSPLGDVAQSMTIFRNKAFVVINNSGKIYALDLEDAQYIGKITGFTSPRYLHVVNENKAYITDLYAREISIINPELLETTGYINTSNAAADFLQHTSEQMVDYNDLVFVTCWSFDNKVLVVDTRCDCIVDSIEVIKQPNSIVIDKFNKIWVLSDGGFTGSAYEQESGGLTKIDAESHTIEQILRFGSLNDSPSELKINGRKDTLYYINTDIYRMPVVTTAFPQKPFIKSESNVFYSLGIDPVTSDVFVADAIDYQQNGLVYRFRYDGVLLDSFRVGIIPGDFCFKYE